MVRQEESAGGGRPLLIVMSAPSGAGKSTLCRRLLSENPGIRYSISCTTRPPRGAEVNGQHYHFLSDAAFEDHVCRNDFLEHAAVHGYRYGTLREPVRQAMAAGRSVLMDIDVQGAAQIRARLAQAPENDLIRRGFVDVFIAPPSLDELRRRLESRGEDAPAVIDVRMKNARAEMERAGEFRYVIVNDRLDAAYARLVGVIGEALGQ